MTSFSQPRNVSVLLSLCLVLSENFSTFEEWSSNRRHLGDGRGREVVELGLLVCMELCSHSASVFPGGSVPISSDRHQARFWPGGHLDFLPCRCCPLLVVKYGTYGTCFSGEPPPVLLTSAPYPGRCPAFLPAEICSGWSQPRGRPPELSFWLASYAF